METITNFLFYNSINTSLTSEIIEEFADKKYLNYEALFNSPSRINNFSIDLINDFKTTSFDFSHNRSIDYSLPRKAPNTNTINTTKPIIDKQEELKKANQILKKETLKYKNIILQLIQSDYYDDNHISNIEIFMKSDCNEDNISCILDAAEMIIKDNKTDEHIVEGILTLISSKSYDDVNPKGMLICQSLLRVKNYSIQDKAIQTFERWNSKKGIEDLQDLEFVEPWLKKYADDVIFYLRKYGTD